MKRECAPSANRGNLQRDRVVVRKARVFVMKKKNGNAKDFRFKILQTSAYKLFSAHLALYLNHVNLMTKAEIVPIHHAHKQTLAAEGPRASASKSRLLIKWPYPCAYRRALANCKKRSNYVVWWVGKWPKFTWKRREL